MSDYEKCISGDSEPEDEPLIPRAKSTKTQTPIKQEAN